MYARTIKFHEVRKSIAHVQHFFQLVLSYNLINKSRLQQLGASTWSVLVLSPGRQQNAVVQKSNYQPRLSSLATQKTQ